jgi:hypothetical protein
MARCDQGYLCEVCGAAVEQLEESDLYLRYILREVSGRDLLTAPERHLRCNPALAQFIVDERFEPVVLAGPFSKSDLPPPEAARWEERVTAAWQRLQQVRQLGLTIAEYPLPAESTR